jgi:hypothetical protein
MGTPNVRVVTGVSRNEVLTAIRICSPLLLCHKAAAAAAAAAAPLKQRKSRVADWLKNVCSSKRSELLECELKKMTTVIVSECTAL